LTKSTTLYVIVGALLLWWLLPKRVKASVTVPDSVTVKVPTNAPGSTDYDPSFVDQAAAAFAGGAGSYDPSFVDQAANAYGTGTTNPLEPPRFVDSASIN
jgi:hypothetical protein